jgi:filamentous hemagglutinin family protein
MTQKGRHQYWRLSLINFVLLCGTIACADHAASAQSKIVPDNTLGAERSIITPSNTNALSDEIKGGAIRGSNLFHSFLDFNVAEGRGAYFVSPHAGIQNILARVTGTQRSEILGTLGTRDGANPNLFLINPHGILFGANATLDVRGSFLATTANAFQFGNQGSFSASHPNAPPLLTINPSALLFNQITAASIQNNSRASMSSDPAIGLKVPDGHSLLFVGGNIEMTGGGLIARGGRVELAGIAGAGSVGLNQNQNEVQLEVPDGLARADVSFSQAAQVSVASAGGGRITINARSLKISGGSALRAGIAKGLGTAGSQAGDITLNATQDIEIKGDTRLNEKQKIESVPSQIQNRVNENSTGNGGNIVIKTRSFSLVNGGRLSASIFGNGNAGNVIVHASSMTMNGLNSDISSNVHDQAIGNGGEINIGDMDDRVDQITIVNGAQIKTNTEGRGNTGSITIHANALNMSGANSSISSNISNKIDKNDEIGITDGKIDIHASTVIMNRDASIESNVGSSTNSAAKGNGRSIQIDTGLLSVMNGARLRSNTYAKGDPGNITINAREIILDGNNRTLGNRRAISSSVFRTARTHHTTRQNRGEIRLTADTLNLRNTAQILADTEGDGDAGNIVIAARQVLLDGSIPERDKAGNVIGRHATAIFSRVSDNGRGKGGTIDITSKELSITRGAGLFATISGKNAIEEPGAIKITSDRVTLAGRGINGETSGIFGNLSETGTGSGVPITIQTGSLLLTDGARLFSRTTGRGSAGDITILSPNRVEISDGAKISVNSLNASNPGNILLQARILKLNNHGAIEGETNQGQQGGDIRLNLQELLLLRRYSTISTSAGKDQVGGGNGGNITITSPLIIAVPGEDSNIVANAYSGRGGFISIDAPGGLFGIDRRNQLTAQNDITAFSQQRPDLPGTIQINTPNVDPSHGLVQLPVTLVDQSRQIAQACAPKGEQGENAFVMTGRSGLPPTPREVVRSETMPLADLGSSMLRTATGRHRDRTTPSTLLSTSNPIVEAQGWIRSPSGDVTLVAQAPTVTPHSSWNAPNSCYVR